MDQKPMFMRIDTIGKYSVDFSKAIRTGITLLDKEIIGLMPGQLSILSGTNGSGKSTWLSQLIVEAANQGKRTVLYSGELIAPRALNWIILPAAGADNVLSTDNERLYRVTNKAREQIIPWLGSKVVIYNDEYGRKAKSIIDALDQRVSGRTKPNLVVIDNLMSIDISEYDRDKLEAQAKFVSHLAEKSKTFECHVILVCHPRKVTGFLRKEDISGNSDLTNVADNVFIVHRVNMDFKARATEVIGPQTTGFLSQYDNVLEVCKNRELGVQDYLVGMYFCKKSHRMQNQQNESKDYGWIKKIEQGIL